MKKIYYINIDTENIFINLKKFSAKKLIKDKVNNISSTIKNDEQLYKKWFNQIKQKKYFYFSKLVCMNNLIYRILKKLNMFKILDFIVYIKKNKILPIWNFCRCADHNESIEALLNEYFKEH